MAKKKVTFIGNPNDGNDGRPFTTAFGETYRLLTPRIVNLSADAEKRLSNNAHFRVENPSEAEMGDASLATALGRVEENFKLAAEASAAEAQSESAAPVIPPQAAPQAQASEEKPVETRKANPRSRAPA
jgi:hypothetical protein